MSGELRPGDRVLDLRAVTRSNGIFAGLLAAPIAAGLSGWWWGWCAVASLGCAGAGFVIAAGVGRVVFPSPPGQTMVVRVGPAALGAALRAALLGGLPICVMCAIGAFVGAGVLAAAIALLAGLGVSAGAGCLAALV